MPVIKKDDVEFNPGLAENTLVREFLNPDSGSGAITLGETIMSPGSVTTPHTHKVEQAWVVTKGTVTFILDDETYTLKPGDVMLAPAGAKHVFANRSNEPVGFLFFYPAVKVQRELV